MKFSEVEVGIYDLFCTFNAMLYALYTMLTAKEKRP